MDDWNLKFPLVRNKNFKLFISFVTDKMINYFTG